MKRLGRAILQIDRDTILYQTSVSKIRTRLKRWPRNRLEDENRVAEIADSLETQTMIDGIVYAWDRTGQAEILQIFDGWTRICAALRAKSDIRVMVAVVTTSEESVVVRWFNRLNRAVPLPMIFTAESSLLKRRCLIEDVTSRVTKTYKPMLSTACTPRKPNFNRDQLFEVLDRALPEGVEETVRPDDVLASLMELNVALKNDTSHRYPEKAVKHDCYLFCVDSDTWRRHFQRNVQSTDLL